MRRILPTLFTLAVLAALIALFRVAQRYDPALQRGPSSTPDISIRLEDARLFSREAGRPRWMVHADRIDVHPAGPGSLDNFRSADFLGIRDGVFYRNGKKVALFSARSATFDQATQQFDIRGGLRLSTPGGDYLEAPSCVWSQREEFARLPGGAKGLFHGHRIAAPYVVYAPKTRVLQCPQGAEATLDGYPLRAASLFWDINAEYVHCGGPVSGERRGLSFTARDATIDLKNHTLRANKGSAQLRIGGGDDATFLREEGR